MSDFLEMPNSAAEKSSVAEPSTEGAARVRAESLTGIRLRDTKTGKFVASPSLVTKKFNIKAFKGLGEATAAGVLAGFVANQLPQNKKTWGQTTKKVEQKLDPKLSVTLKKKPDKA